MKKRPRKIAILTGKRGGFGALIGVMKLIAKDPALKFDLIVTDMHLSPKFGSTVQEVEKWFKVSSRIDLEQSNDSARERAKALGRAVIKMVEVLTKLKPDILLTLGDRGEVLSAAIAALELNIPIAHILGGDVAGNRDGNRIHAITKLAHLHFPSSQDSYQRILKLGEEPWRVHNVGASYIDYIVAKKYTPNKAVRKKYHLGPREDYFICIQHPMTMQEGRSYDEMYQLLSALKSYGTRTIIVYPCSDQGYQGTLAAINKFKNVPFFDVYKNIEALDFWGLQSGAKLFIGNSSSGLMETPYFKLPTVNIGNRQKGRIHDNNVIDASPKPTAILSAINRALSKSFRSKISNHHVFGNGQAGKKIVAVLKNVEINDKLLMKKITF